jgi:hypothetical protein
VAAAGLALLVGQVLYRTAFMLRMRLWRHMPLPFLGPAEAPSIMVVEAFTRWAYLGFAPRSSALSLGVLAVLAATDARMQAILQR